MKKSVGMKQLTVDADSVTVKIKIESNQIFSVFQKKIKSEKKQTK